MKPELEEVQLAFPRRAGESFPMSLLENRNNATTAVDKLIARDWFDLEAFRRFCGGVEGDVVGGTLGVQGVQDVLGEVSWTVFWEGRGCRRGFRFARFESSGKDVAVIVPSRPVRGNIKIQKSLSSSGRPPGGCQMPVRADGGDLVWADPVKGQFGVGHNVVSAFLGGWWKRSYKSTPYHRQKTEVI